MKATSLALALLVPAISGCGHGAKERTAPCKRPAALTAFQDDMRDLCGQINPIDQDHQAVIDVIARISDKKGE